MEVCKRSLPLNMVNGIKDEDFQDNIKEHFENKAKYEDKKELAGKGCTEVTNKSGLGKVARMNGDGSLYHKEYGTAVTLKCKSEPMEDCTSDSVKSGTTDPLENWVLNLKKSGTPESLEDSISDPVISGSIDRMEESTSDPLRNGAIDRMEESTSDPLRSDTIDQMEDSTSDPVKSGTIDQIEDSNSDPVKSGTTDPMEGCTSDPVKSSNSNPIENSTSDPVKSGTIDQMEDSTSDPVKSGTTDPMENSTSDPVKSGISDPIESCTSDPMEDETGTVSTVIDINLTTCKETGESNDMSYADRHDEGYSDDDKERQVDHQYLEKLGLQMKNPTKRDEGQKVKVNGTSKHIPEPKVKSEEKQASFKPSQQQYRKRSGQKHYRCLICGYSTNSYKLHKKHSSTHTGRETRKAIPITRRVEFQKMELEEEKVIPLPEELPKKEVKKEKPFKCKKCKFRTDTTEKLEAHFAVHAANKKFTCDVCAYSCATRTGLGRHMKKHQEEIKLQCDLCTFTADDEKILELHKKIHIEEEKKLAEEGNGKIKTAKLNKKQRFRCEVCDYRTTNEELFLIHWNRHTGEKFYNCDQCIFGTNNKSVFQSHQRLHLGAKPFKCDICGSGFTQLRGLKTHQKTNICALASGDKAVNQTVTITRDENELEKHQTVSKESKAQRSSQKEAKTYQCNECGFSTSRPSHLKRHKIIHSGLKPYKCDHCDYRANFKINLQTHMKIHSDEKPQACTYCSYTTYREDHLKRHLATHKEVKILWAGSSKEKAK